VQKLTLLNGQKENRQNGLIKKRYYAINSTRFKR
jgi:hypothetical protein